MPLSVQPLQNVGKISGVALAPNPQSLAVKPLQQKQKIAGVAQAPASAPISVQPVNAQPQITSVGTATSQQPYSAPAPAGDLSPENRAKLNEVVHKMTLDKRQPSEIQTAVDQFKTKYASPTTVEEAPADTNNGNFFQRVGTDLKKRYSNTEEAATRTGEGKQSFPEFALQGLGQVAGGIGDLIGEGAKSVYRGVANTQRAVGLGFVPDTLEALAKKAGQGIGAVAGNLQENTINNATFGSDPIGATLKAIQGSDRAKANLGAVGNIASLIPIGRGEKLAQEGLQSAIPDLAGAAATKMEAKGAINSLNKTLEAISPVLTKGEATEAVAAGKAEAGGLFSRAKILPTPQDMEIAKTVQGIVKGKSAIADINAVRGEISKVSDSLRAGLKDFKGIVSPSQFKGALMNVEKSPFLVGDAEKTFQKVLNKAIEIQGSHPGTVAGLDAARVEFDQYVKKFLPNTFGDATANAMNTTIKDLRIAWNDYIASRLPEGNPYKAELQKMSNMYRAVDSLSTKAVGELGANKFTKFTNVLRNHPYVALATGGGLSVAGSSLAPLIFNPVSLAALAGGATIYYGGRAITSDVAKQALLAALKATADPAQREAVQAIIRTLEQGAIKGNLTNN